MDRKHRSLVTTKKIFSERPVTRLEQVKTAVKNHSLTSRWTKFKNIIFSTNGKLGFLFVFSGVTLFKVLKPMYKEYKSNKSKEFADFLWEQEQSKLKDK